MTAVAHGTRRPGRSLIGKLAEGLAARARGKGRISGKVAAFAAAAREHVLTGAALTSADLGAFHWGAGVGGLVTAVSLLALDFAIRG